MPTPPACGDGLALGGTTDRATATEHDLAGDELPGSSVPGRHRSSPSSSASTSGRLLPTAPGVERGALDLATARRLTSPSKKRCWVLAPTVVSHGALPGEPIVSAPGPLLPADVATNTPASAANRNAMSSAPGRLAPAADRVVDDVDAVEHRLVDRGREVGA